MKYLICGLGSIGERHLKNLLSLGEKDIIAYRVKNLPLRNISKKIPFFSSLKEALKQKPDAALITNPSIYHVPLALKLAEYGCHLFIEKPLSINLKNIDKLSQVCKKKKLIVFIGFMMRYHPAVIQIREWLKQEIIGFPISARFSCGQFLPSWHPWEDYRISYAASKKLSGGIVFTLCHEIDLASFFFGQVKSISAFTSRKSSLEISSEHSIEVLLEFENKLIVEIHLDFLQFPGKRNWEIVGDRGKIEYDYYNNKLDLYLTSRDDRSYKQKTVDFFGKLKRNDIFISEMKKFIYSLKNLKEAEINLNDGINNLKTLLAIEKSVKEKKIVNLSEILL